MANETIITLVGNLTAEPELRYTASGTPVTNFTVASTPRTFDRNSGQWQDGETLFVRCSVWREAAENVADSLSKGMRVIVQGQLTQHSYEGRDGQQRTSIELRVEEVGPSLRRARAQVTRNAAPNGATSQNQGGYGRPAQGTYQQAPAPQQATYNQPAGGSSADPWSNQPTLDAYDEPPF